MHESDPRDGRGPRPRRPRPAPPAESELNDTIDEVFATVWMLLLGAAGRVDPEPAEE